MTVIVKNGVFMPDTLTDGWSEFDTGVVTDAEMFDLSSDTDPRDLLPYLQQATAFRVNFPSSADGRGSSIARYLRISGFSGHLRARGHILADQYPLILRSGFDDVEIDEALAKRMPEAQWSEAYGRIADTYQAKLRGHPRHNRRAA